MASEAYLKVKGFDYRIGTKSAARGAWIPLESLTFGSPAPGRIRGKQTGRRIHDTVKVARFVDSTTPLILRALCKSEVDEVTFRFRGSVPGRDGTRPILRCRIGKAVVVGRKVKPSPKGGNRNDSGMEELVLRCTGLMFCSD